MGMVVMHWLCIKCHLIQDDSTWLHQVGAAVIPWDTMSRTGYQSEQLWRGQQEIKDLRDKEQQQRLAVMGQDPDHCERHARKVTICVTNEHLARVPIVDQQAGAHTDEWHDKVQ